MEKNNVLSELIYEYYESRILFGIFRYGEQLKSVPQICASFGLARNTVQTALNKLEEAGYIKTERRKVAKVAYQGTQDMFRENAAKYFVPRKDGIRDINNWGPLMFSTVWEKGLENLELNTPGDICEKKNTDEILALEPTKLYVKVLSTFHNDLMDNLYWQFLRYLNYFYPKKDDEETGYTEADFASVETINDIKEKTDNYYWQTHEKILSFVESIHKKYQLENVEQIPFTWTIYRRRPQVRYTLASAIIREILWEAYPVGSYLPSLSKMVERYQVPLITMRRTMEVLHSLGVTKTQVGKGVLVCLDPIDSDIVNRQEIRESLLLYGEGMELLALTVYNVTLFTLESITEDQKEDLLQQLSKLHGKNNNILCIDVLLKFISTECPSPFLRECYGKLRELVTWGYIFFAIMKGNGEYQDMDLTDFISQLEMNLRTDNLTAFAAQWQSFIEDGLNFFRSKFPSQDRQKI